MTKLSLPTVTLCAIASVNVKATEAALRACMRDIAFADCRLLTHDASVTADPRIQVIPIEPLGSSADYSRFVLERLADHVPTEHCLIVQWDGFILEPSRWNAEFLNFDYIGAPWPQFDDGHDVGNGGFSLRSRRLLEACRDSGFRFPHPEDVAICRLYRSELERNYDLRFADRAQAERFAFERTAPREPTFGFHGVFNMIPALGSDEFWKIYTSLDDSRTVSTDYWMLMKQLGSADHAWRRRFRLTLDRLKQLIGP